MPYCIAACEDGNIYIQTCTETLKNCNFLLNINCNNVGTGVTRMYTIVGFPYSNQDPQGIVYCVYKLKSFSLFSSLHKLHPKKNFQRQ